MMRITTVSGKMDWLSQIRAKADYGPDLSESSRYVLLVFQLSTLLSPSSSACHASSCLDQSSTRLVILAGISTFFVGLFQPGIRPVLTPHHDHQEIQTSF
jgi:hypothetical protein